MRLLRSTGFNIIMFGSGAVLSIWCALVARYLPDGIVRAARLWGRISLWALRVCCGVALEVEGRENLPEGGAIIAAQHQSALDILIWLSVVRHPVFVFKKELKRIPVFGGLMEPAGMISVDRGGGSTALREMVAGAITAARAGHQVIIFPEGTRVAYGVRGRIKNGIIALAHHSRMPVLPAATNSGLRWGRKSYGKHPGPVHITIKPPMPVGLTREEIVQWLERIYYGEQVAEAEAA
jgi:1-acyl-sn-glycerol-3-phosphate acyltransferase